MIARPAAVPDDAAPPALEEARRIVRVIDRRAGAQAWLSDRELWVVCDDDEDAITVSADERAAARAALPAARVVGPRA